jgi:hypothetical protein
VNTRWIEAIVLGTLFLLGVLALLSKNRRPPG